MTVAAGREAGALDVLSFWWEAGPARWFARSDEFDAACRDRFGALHDRAARGELDHWKETPHGCLALILLLDQMPRNIHRGTAGAFASDAAGLAAAEHAIEKGFPAAYPPAARIFFYMPFMHSEDIAVQRRGVDLFRVLGEHESYHYALIHLDVIARFGRFPHRNEMLGRETTPEERAYLETGGFSG